MQLTYSTRVVSSLDYSIEKEVVNAVKSSPELRAEMRRIFQIANRRIQNIEKSGVFSPAVASLGKGDIDKFTKFGFRGKDWKTLKKEYGKAVSFLQQPTSTATGARQFEEQVKAQLDIGDEAWERARETVLNNYDAVTTDLIETLPYKKLVQEMYSETTDDVSDMIERDAKAIADDLEQQINKASKDVSDSVMDMIKGFEIDL